MGGTLFPGKGPTEPAMATSKSSSSSRSSSNSDQREPGGSHDSNSSRIRNASECASTRHDKATKNESDSFMQNPAGIETKEPSSIFFVAGTSCSTNCTGMAGPGESNVAIRPRNLLPPCGPESILSGSTGSFCLGAAHTAGTAGSAPLLVSRAPFACGAPRGPHRHNILAQNPPIIGLPLGATKGPLLFQLDSGMPGTQMSSHMAAPAGPVPAPHSAPIKGGSHWMPSVFSSMCGPPQNIGHVGINSMTNIPLGMSITDRNLNVGSTTHALSQLPNRPELTGQAAAEGSHRWQDGSKDELVRDEWTQFLQYLSS